MTRSYFGPKWESHIMGLGSGTGAFHNFEDVDAESRVIHDALSAMQDVGMLSSVEYDATRYDAFAKQVKDTFDIPWTGISPRMRRLIYAINAIHKPKALVCAGIFCGYTFICNAGASTGPGKCFDSEIAIGFEVIEQEVERARANVCRYSPGSTILVEHGDATDWLNKHCSNKIDLLYIDAKPVDWNRSWEPGETASEYWKIANSALKHLRKGSFILAHNSVNASEYLADYLSFVRSDTFSQSINLVVDDAGLEVTLV